MKGNDREKKIQQEIRQEVPIPDVVKDKVQDAYRMIESHQIVQDKTEKHSYRWMSVTARAAGIVAAVLAIGFMVCVTNPVMARELPVVGGLFERLQDKVSFFGNFADKAEVLEKPEERVYTKTRDGLTVTFSEVYANEQAIYLTMQVKSEEPFPDVRMDERGPGFEIMYKRDYSFMNELPEGYKKPGQLAGEMQAKLEGMLEDENTYSCILRIDLNEDTKDKSEFLEQYDAMTQQVLDDMGITDDDMNDDTEEGYALLSEFLDTVSTRGGSLRSLIKQIPVPESFVLHLDITGFLGYKAEPEYRQNPNEQEHFLYDNSWEFDIPIHIDASQTVTMEINETNEAGIGLASVVKTPYELTVNELYEEGSDSDCFMVALDANGNKLPYNESNNSTNNFVIQDRDISTVDIYILDYAQYMDELKGEERYNNNENKPEAEKWSTLLDANAKYHKTIHFE